MNKPSAVNTNSLKISEDVIAKIVEVSVNDIKEVKEITKSKFDIAGILLKSDSKSDISINVNGDSVEISLGVIVDLNCKVKNVAEKIQQKIKDEVQNMTGIIVTRVNVNVDGIIFDNQ